MRSSGRARVSFIGVTQGNHRIDPLVRRSAQRQAHRLIGRLPEAGREKPGIALNRLRYAPIGEMFLHRLMFTLPRNPRVSAEPLHCLVEPAGTIVAAERNCVATSVVSTVDQFDGLRRRCASTRADHSSSPSDAAPVAR